MSGIERRLQVGGRVLVEPGHRLGVHPSDAGGRAEQPVALGILADGQQDLADGGFDAGQIDGAHGDNHVGLLTGSRPCASAARWAGVLRSPTAEAETTAQVARLCSTGAATVVATADDAGGAAITRGWGIGVSPTGLVTLCVSASAGSQTQANLAANGRIAVTLVDPTTYAAMQVKGIAEIVREPNDHERELVADHLRRFSDAVATIGLLDVNDNLDARLVALRRRLAERGDPFQLDRAGRGQLELTVDAVFDLTIVEPAEHGVLSRRSVEVLSRPRHVQRVSTDCEPGTAARSPSTRVAGEHARISS